MMKRFLHFTHKVHPILSQPVEALQEEQEGEEGDKPRGEIISEHGEGQARLCHCVPGALDEMLMEVGRVHINIKFHTFYHQSNISYVKNVSENSTSISAALSCPKKTFLINFPKRNTRTNA